MRRGDPCSIVLKIHTVAALYVDPHIFMATDSHKCRVEIHTIAGLQIYALLSLEIHTVAGRDPKSRRAGDPHISRARDHTVPW